MFDFSELKAVETANPKGQNFDIKWNKTKQEFLLSDKMFDKMTLEYNSLQQFNRIEKIPNEDGLETEVIKDIFLFVCPGNDGVFHKKQKGKQKGKRFKNAKLSVSCELLGLTPENIAISYEGEHENKEVFRIHATVEEEVAVEEPVAEVQDVPEPELNIVNQDENF